MPVQPFDALRLRATASITRRHAFPALGSAAFTARMSSRPGLAAQGNDKRKAKKKFRKRCNQQKAQCRARFADEPSLLACCDSCFSDDYLACLFPFVAE